MPKKFNFVNLLRKTKGSDIFYCWKWPKYFFPAILATKMLNASYVQDLNVLWKQMQKWKWYKQQKIQYFIQFSATTLPYFIWKTAMNFWYFVNRSESEEPKTKSIGIVYKESKPFRSESVTCLNNYYCHVNVLIYCNDTIYCNLQSIN